MQAARTLFIATLALCCASCALLQGNQTIMGTLVGPYASDGSCDLNGAGVVVRNEKGDVIGSSTAAAKLESDGKGGLECITHFRVPVASAKFYQVKIGTHDGPTYSFNELKANGFKIALDLR